MTLRRERIGEKMASDAKEKVRAYQQELDAKSNEDVAHLAEEERENREERKF